MCLSCCRGGLGFLVGCVAILGSYIWFSGPVTSELLMRVIIPLAGLCK